MLRGKFPVGKFSSGDFRRGNSPITINVMEICCFVLAEEHLAVNNR